MKKIKVLFALTLLVFVSSCKSLKPIKPKPELDSNLKAKVLIKSISPLSFKTLNLRGKVRLQKGDFDQSIQTNIRVQSNQKIWISASLIVPIAKGVIDEEGLVFYDKINRNYYQGNFDRLYDLLGISIDFNDLNRLIFGRPVLERPFKRSKLTFDQASYVMSFTNSRIEQTVRFDSNFLMQNQYVRIRNQSILVQYSDYQKKEGIWIPMKIECISEDATLSFIIRKAEVDRDLAFPFEIPEGYHRIEL